MKLRHSLIIGCLTALLGFGAFVGVNVNREAKVEKAEAATGDANSDIYLNLNDNQCKWKEGSARFFFICKDKDGNDGNWYEFTQTVTPLGTSDTIYHLTIPVSYAKFTVVRRNPEHTTTWAYINTYTSSDVSSQNVIKVYNYGNDGYTYSALDDSAYNIYSFSASASNGTALVSQKSGSENRTSGYFYAHMEFKVSGVPSANYYFNRWNITGSTTALDGTSTSNQTYKFKPKANLTIVGNYKSAGADATTFANNFKTSMSNYCPITGSDANKGIAKLTSEWSDFNDEFDGLPSEVQEYLKSNGAMAEFRERYDSILTDYYSYLSGYDFLNRASTLGLSNKVELKQASETVSVSTTVMTILALTAVVSVGGFFFLKKKKSI